MGKFLLEPGELLLFRAFRCLTKAGHGGARAGGEEEIGALVHPAPDMSLGLRLLPTREPELSQNHTICQPGPRPCSRRQKAWGRGPPPLLRSWFFWALQSLSTRGPEVAAPSRAPALSYIPISMIAAAGRSSLFSPAGLSSPKPLFSLEDYALKGYTESWWPVVAGP